MSDVLEKPGKKTVDGVLRKHLRAVSESESPETNLMVEVLVRSVQDGLKHLKSVRLGHVEKHDFRDGFDFCTTPNRFSPHCEILGIEPSYFQRLTRRIFKAEPGLNKRSGGTA